MNFFKPSFSSFLARRSFHSSLLKNSEAVVKGGDKLHGSYHWQFERIVSVALVPLVTIPLFTGPSRTVDFFLTFLLPIHCHMGWGQMITDYLNKRKVGTLLNRAAVGSLYGLTALTIYGLYKFNTNDVGITEFVRNVWKGPSASVSEKK